MTDEEEPVALSVEEIEPQSTDDEYLKLFGMYVDEGALTLVSTDLESYSHSVKVTTIQPIIKYLDIKYIKDMYGETKSQEVTLIDGVYEGFEDWDGSYGWESYASFELINGQTYTVIWDGITYADIICIDDGYGGSVIGNPNDNFATLPFFVFYSDDYFGFCTNSTVSSHSIKITTIQSEIIKIDKKYLPDLVGKNVTGQEYVVSDDMSNS
jgi:hypothetical protein